MMTTTRNPGRRPDAGCGAALVLAAVLAIPAAAQSPPPATAAVPATIPEAGVWIDETGQGAVEIAPCGDKLCGRIVWLRDRVDAKGRPPTDDLNSDKALRSRPVCGLQVLGNLARQRDGGWDAGWVYDPKTGDKYDAAIKLAGADRLAVTGYLGVKLLGETFTWTRASADRPLPPCGP
jgi:uncharacterized protein (DUF2147 family)